MGLRSVGIAEPEPCEVWPEHWQAVLVFVALQTQWSVGLAGPTGLRYESIPVVLRLQGVPRAEWRETFQQIRVMECEALAAFSEARANKGQ